MSFTELSPQIIFPNFMGMLCNKDADVENLCVCGNVFNVAASKGKSEEKSLEMLKYWMCEEYKNCFPLKKLNSTDPRAIIQIQEFCKKGKKERKRN